MMHHLLSESRNSQTDTRTHNSCIERHLRKTFFPSTAHSCSVDWGSYVRLMKQHVSSHPHSFLFLPSSSSTITSHNHRIGLPVGRYWRAFSKKSGASLKSWPELNKTGTNIFEDVFIMNTILNNGWPLGILQLKFHMLLNIYQISWSESLRFILKNRFLDATSTQRVHIS